MGAWDVGLYASDFALDLRGVIGAMARLPRAGNELLALLRARYAVTAERPDDEDHTIFWLVTADQFARRHIDVREARVRASAIIDNGEDIAMHRALGMTEADLRKRAVQLSALRPRLDAPIDASKRRGVLRQPQPYLLEIGDCVTYPTSGGKSINAYFPNKTADRTWHHDGWGAAVLCERGRAFDYLAWYRLCALDTAFAAKPDLTDIRAGAFGAGLSAGTCSPTHFKRMELERIGTLPVVPGAITRLVPELTGKVRSGDTAAILDVSLCNNLQARAYAEAPRVAEVLVA